MILSVKLDGWSCHFITFVGYIAPGAFQYANHPNPSYVHIQRAEAVAGNDGT